MHVADHLLYDGLCAYGRGRRADTAASRTPGADQSARPDRTGHVLLLRESTNVRWPRLREHEELGGRILLRVHASVLEVVMAGMEWAGRSMGSEVLLETKTSRMHRAKLGWAGTALGARPVILITGQNPGGRIQVAIAPGTHLEEAWEALVLAGVTPDTQ
jgi:hypothetical protein